MSRWSDLAVWRGPTVNQGPRMKEQRGLVVHIAEGSYEGTIAWQKNPDANVSSHFVVDLDGDIAQMVDTDTAAWTQRDGNGYWLSVENAGHTPRPLTAAQVEANARILARGHLEHGYPLAIATCPADRGLGHHSMGAECGANWGHSQCPGPAIKAQKPAILARAIQIVNGDDMAFMDDRDAAIVAWRVEALIHNRPTVTGGPTAGERNDLHFALAEAAAVLTPAQLAAVGTAAEAGAEKGVDEALDEATVTTTIHIPEPA